MQSKILPRDKMEGSAALFVTSWKKTSYSPANWKMIIDFCEHTLKKKPAELSKIHCTVLDVDVRDEEKEDAERYGVTLIPATRPAWSHPLEDLPTITWLLFPEAYYPNLGKLENINHVVAFSSNATKTAARLQESLFPGARFCQTPSSDPLSTALFIYDVWNSDQLGLNGFHRTIINDFCERKAKAGENLIAYSTVLDVNISDKQRTDAENCHVTLIPVQENDRADVRTNPPRLEWLLHHEIYYPDLKELENVQYVIGYAPKTGLAAAKIRGKLFPGAKLVLINHASPERNCLQAEEYGLSEFEEEMLRMASEADFLFSIGPSIYDFFQNAYRAEFQGRDLSDIPHEEILPRPDECFWEKNPKERPVTQHHILTCGQMDTQKAIKRYKTIAASIGTAANHQKAHDRKQPEWKIQGVAQQAGKSEQKFLAKALKSQHYIYPKLKPGHSANSLLTSLQQSHLCLPASSYSEYSFYGLEAMAFGLPTAVDENSHLGHFVMKYLDMHVDYCVVRTGKGKLSEKISQHLEDTSLAFKKAKALKSAMLNCEAFTQSFAKFASLFKEPVHNENGQDCKDLEGKDFPVNVSLDEEMLQKRLTELEKQTQAVSVQLQRLQEMKKNEVKTGWGECEHGLKRRVQAVLADEESCNEVKKVCMEKVGLDPTTVTAESLGILLKILTLYYLYRVKQTCRSRNLAKALEPLLITDEMRKIAATVGITLQLKAMYDKAKFEEIEFFFVNRDGGGIQPITFHGEIEDNDSLCNLDLKGEKPSLSQQASDPVVEPSQTNLEQSLEEKLTQHGDPTLSITAAYSSLSLQARSLLPIKPSKYQLTDSDIRYLALAKSKVQSLQSQLDKAFTEKLILQGRLTDALNEKSQFKLQCDEYMQKYQNAEKVVATQLSEINTPTAQLKEKDKVITGLRIQLEQVSGAQSDIELLKKLAEERQLGETIVISEMDDIADNEYTKPKITEIEKEEASQPKMTSMEGSGMESTATPTQPEMTGRDRSEMETATSTQPEMTGMVGHGIKTEAVTTATEHQTGKRDSSGIFGKFFERLTGRKDKTDVGKVMSTVNKELSGSVTAGSKELSSSSGPVSSVMSGGIALPGSKEEQSGSYSDGSGKGSDLESMEKMVDGGATLSSAGRWSRRILKGHQRQKFKGVSGLAFHNDKLLVCDSDNNIVHILNQDYRCEKELGSFSGQFQVAKPFKPQSIAVSQDNPLYCNLYFILDNSNLQIVVCDQNNKVIRIITLPTDSEPWCIALVKGFVIVTDVKGHRVLKYSQTGQYISEFGHQGNHKTRLDWPDFVAVNSRDVIMVSDSNNHCIKCFDTDLNYLYQYGHPGTRDGQLSYPLNIAVDGADHVYVCDNGNNRISIWSRHGTWTGNLFHRELILPRYMAVTADGDRIAVRGLYSDDIVVFSK